MACRVEGVTDKGEDLWLCNKPHLGIIKLEIGCLALYGATVGEAARTLSLLYLSYK